MWSGAYSNKPKYNEVTGRMRDPPQYQSGPVQVGAASEGATGDVDEEVELDEDEIEEDEAEEGEDETVKWKVGEPKQQPLRYQVPTASGGFETRTISFPVDFTSRDLVNKANKQRRLEQYRAKIRHGLQDQLLRPATTGREYQQVHDTYIIQQHQTYAAAHNNVKIPYTTLTINFNNAFPGQNRTKNSISSHVEQKVVLKGMRAQYDGADDE